MKQEPLDPVVGPGCAMELKGKVSSPTKSISRSGVICRTSRRLDEMTLLDVRFRLPKGNESDEEDEWIECSGIVVHCEEKDPQPEELPYEVAIFFDRISEKHKQLLASLGSD